LRLRVGPTVYEYPYVHGEEQSFEFRTSLDHPGSVWTYNYKDSSPALGWQQIQLTQVNN